MLWFALQVRQQYERLSAISLSNRGFEAYLPVYESRRQWCDRVKRIALPLFPGYVFCRFDPSRRLLVMTSPGVIRVVGLGRTPAPVDDAELTAVRTAADSGLDVQPWRYLSSGQRVRIEAGALRGVEGIFVEHKKQCRLIVSVELLQRSIAVEVDASWVSPLAGTVPRRPDRDFACSSAA